MSFIFKTFGIPATIGELAGVLCYYAFSVIYPVYRSSMIARGKETDESKMILLKFWSVNCFVYFTKYYTYDLLMQFDFGEGCWAIVYLVLVLDNFRIAEWLYDSVLFDVFETNQKMLHNGFKWVRQTFETKIWHVVNISVDLMWALIAGLVKKSPTAVQIPLKLLGLHDFLEKKLAAYEDASATVR